VGQEAAREGLERGLESGVRRLLLLGPEGSGKSTWMRALAEQGRGVLVAPDSLDRAPVDAVLLVEDVDRLPPPEQDSLGAFLARHSGRTVLMTARGDPAAPGLVLLSDSGRLPVPTTAALSEAVQGALPLVLLEQVQSLIPLETPTIEDLIEIARRQLASREDRHLSDEVLTALATEAARSPRSGHELQALLARVPPGTWRLEVKKKRKASPARRGRRKGKS
jgi:ABC-type cobalamin/Fe3+-siderophores transport system ATPase subunit